MKATVGKLTEPAQYSLELLKEGNQRFVQGIKSLDSLSGVTKLKELAYKEQSPFSIILTCADSRAPAETIFDRGFGDLFVLRVAGNIATPELVASIELAAIQFNTPLCVVMGHTGCGAIRAATQALKTKDYSSSVNTQILLKRIAPSVKKADRLFERKSETFYETASTLLNIKTTAKQILQMSPLLTERIYRQEFAIVESLYDLYTGRVHFNIDEILSSSRFPGPI